MRVTGRSIVALNPRKSKTTEEKKKLVLKTLCDELGSVSKACKIVGIARQTFYRWADEDINFREQWKLLRETMVDTAEDGLMGLVRAGDPKAIFFLLETLGKTRGYTKRQEIIDPSKHRNAPPGKLPMMKHLQEVLNDEELKQITNIAAKLGRYTDGPGSGGNGSGRKIT
jgi:transposase-like protein